MTDPNGNEKPSPEVIPLTTLGHASQHQDARPLLTPTQQNAAPPPDDPAPAATRQWFPVLFERSAGHCSLRFDEIQLENNYEDAMLLTTRRLLRYCLGYISVSCICWCAYVGVRRRPGWAAFVGVSLALLVVSLVAFWLTCCLATRRLLLSVSVVMTTLLCLCDLLTFLDDANSSVSTTTRFVWLVEIVLLTYVIIPFPLCARIPISLLFSVAFELLSAYLDPPTDVRRLVGRILLHVCVHVLGVHIVVAREVRQRTTFLKARQSSAHRRRLSAEKQLTMDRIHSLMPPKIAAQVMLSHDDDDDDDEGNVDKDAAYHPFYVLQMDNVSILFADIVGFTKLCSLLSAEEVVVLLNALFGRFDELCQRSGCEKISTIGDCYYCVSGCPEARSDHARCCVEMGLAMCKAIREFDAIIDFEVRHEVRVDMRVGVHSGSVLSGLVGTRRFKFDVFSHDVTLANTMESSGQPGRVHISDDTRRLLGDLYELTPGEDVNDIRKHSETVERFDPASGTFVIAKVERRKFETSTVKTWFVVGRRPGTQPANCENEGHPCLLTRQPIDDLRQPLNNCNGDAIQMTTNEENSEDPEDEDDQDKLTLPAINWCSTNFSDHDLETSFRRHSYDKTQLPDAPPTLATPGYGALCDILISSLFYFLIVIICFVSFTIRTSLLIVTIFGGLFEVLLLTMLFLGLSGTQASASCSSLMRMLSGWYPRHVIGLVASSLPTAVAYSAFSCSTTHGSVDVSLSLFYCLLVIVSLIHCCNMALIRAAVKSSLATAAGIVLVIIVAVGVCVLDVPPSSSNCPDVDSNATTVNVRYECAESAGYGALWVEIFLDVSLLLVLVWMLNREIEISYRLLYWASNDAVSTYRTIQRERDRASRLLYTIIPEHVADTYNNRELYSETCRNVGVIFAKISNFDDYYSEEFDGGRGYLWTLNQLMAEFETLLDLPRYKDVEKIKTIGACLMVASGLNPSARPSRCLDPNGHLYALMDYAVDLVNKLNEFNTSVPGFRFEIEIGYNCGTVKAGVVGSTKLLFDVWGDTVNVASRMCSTGVEGRIQVTGETAALLRDRFQFEFRGIVFVKGKGDINTFLYSSRI